MARPSIFDRDEVIRKALDVFWDKGFDSTSIQDLEKATGLKRGSLYNAFGDKAGLFDAALLAYTADNPSVRFVRTAATAPPKKAIQTLFRELLADAQTFGAGRGCFVSHSLSGGGEGARECERTIGDAYASLGRALKRAVARGQKDGSIPARQSPQVMANFLLTTIHGMSAAGRAGVEPKVLRDTVHMALACLD